MRKIVLTFLIIVCLNLSSCKMEYAVFNPIEATTSPYEEVADTAENENSLAYSDDTTATQAESKANFEDTAAQAESDAELYKIPNREMYKQPLTEDKIKGYVYLTIDDGPCKHTDRVLDILDEYGVKATFFLIGNNLEGNENKVKRIYESGHDIGCHSMTHKYENIYKSGQAAENDILLWEKAVSEIIGEIPEEKLYRFPGGSTNTIIGDMYDEIYEAVKELGYRCFDWNCANCDKWLSPMEEGQTREEYFKESVISTIGYTGKKKIMLIHETVGDTVNMLEWIIEYIRSEGYEFALLSENEDDFIFRK